MHFNTSSPHAMKTLHVLTFHHLCLLRAGFFYLPRGNTKVVCLIIEDNLSYINPKCQIFGVAQDFVLSQLVNLKKSEIFYAELTSHMHLLKCRISFSSSCTSRQKAVSTHWRSWCTTIPRCPTASSPRCTTRRRSATSPPSTEFLPTMISGRWSALTLPWSTSWEGASTGRCMRAFGRSTTSLWLSRH